MGRAAGSSNLPNSSKRKTTVRWTVVFLFLPRSGPNFSLRPKAALLSKALPSAEYSAPRARDGSDPPSRRGTVGPTISFLQKETVPPGGTREKSSGPGSRSSYLKLKCAPTPHKVFREAPSPSKEGVQGARPHLPVGHSALNPPGAFLLDRQAARSLFPGKREWGAESASPWGR